MEVIAHSSNLTQKILHKVAGLYCKGFLCDVTLIVGSLRIPAHRVLLTAASEYLSSVLMTEGGEPTEAEVTLTDCNGNAVCAIVQYIYTGKLDPEGEDVGALLEAARLLQFPDVEEICFKYLKETLHSTVGNWSRVRQLALKYGNQDLVDSSLLLASEKFPELVKSTQWPLLLPDEVEALLSSLDLHAPSEEFVFTALIKWIEFDMANRSVDFGKLFKLIKVALLSPEFIFKYVQTHPLVMANVECLPVLMDAWKYQTRLVRVSDRMILPRKGATSCKATLVVANYNNSIRILKHDEVVNTWNLLTVIELDLYRYGVAVMGDILYIVGGSGSNSVHNYCLTTGAITSGTPMLTTRQALGLSVLKNFLYAIGGYNELDGYFLDSGERFNPVTEEWETIAPMINRRGSPSTAVWDDKIYVFGGFNGSGCLNSVECYDPASNVWTLCSAMAQMRLASSTAVLEGKIYVAGGFETNTTITPLASVEKYDPMSDRWEMVAPLNHSRGHLAMTVVNGKILAIGGSNAEKWVDLVEAYDQVTNKWDYINSLPDTLRSPYVVNTGLS